MVRSGKVSVWVGEFDSEESLLTYIDDGRFGQEFDLIVSPEFSRELNAEPQPVSCEQLISGVSYSDIFGQACLKRLRDLGISEAKCMVIFYAFEYSPSLIVSNDFMLTFVGTFDF
jgi:hypothetical protein